MALIPPGGDHWIECEWRLHYPESPCPYSAAFTTTYEVVLAVNTAATVITAVAIGLRVTVMKKQFLRKKGGWLKSIDPFEFIFLAVLQFVFCLSLSPLCHLHVSASLNLFLFCSLFSPCSFDFVCSKIACQRLLPEYVLHNSNFRGIQKSCVLLG